MSGYGARAHGGTHSIELVERQRLTEEIDQNTARVAVTKIRWHPRWSVSARRSVSSPASAGDDTSKIKRRKW
jgi:hypothetical protein